jgi:hypothetical protein
MTQKDTSMRKLASIGFLTLTGALAFACGDDDPTPLGNGGTGSGNGGNAGAAGRAGAGSGGSAGAAGNPGNGGTAGAAGAAGAGTGGTGGGGGTGGSSSGDPDAGPDGGDASDGADAGDGGVAPCSGCLELRVPVELTDAQNELQTFFNINFGQTLRNFSTGTATFRIKALQQGDGLGVSGIANSGVNFTGFAQGDFVSLNAFNGFVDDDTFVNVPFNLGAITGGGFDNTEVVQLGLAVAAPGFDGSFDTLTVFIDSITFTGVTGLANMNFTADAEGFAVGSVFETGSAVIHHP